MKELKIWERVRAFAPATVTNLSAGFDIMGFALHTPGDEVVLYPNACGQIRIRGIYPEDEHIPLEVEANTAGRALKAMQHTLRIPLGVDVEIYKTLNTGTGLGSSAASAAAAVWAYNQFLDPPLSRRALLPFAIEGEKAASGGSVHIDNVAASLLGGLVIIRNVQPPDVLSIPFPEQLRCVVVHPHIELKTADMRAILQEHIPLRQAVEQWGNIAGLVVGFMQRDVDLIRRSMKDVIVEPIRGQVIPGFEKAREAALQAGAIGCGISGSGPSLFALVESEAHAHKVGKAMQQVYNSLGVQSDVFISAINPRGATLLNEGQ